MKQPTVFFGASSYVIPLLIFLHEKYDLTFVLTTEQKPTDPVITYCRENNVPYETVLSFRKKPELAEKLTEIHADFAVLAHFGALVPQSIIDIFPKGILNIHPSRLPQYRGPTPGQTAILLGDIRTAVSIMLLDNEIDHGPLLVQEPELILPNDTAPVLYTRLFAKGATILAEMLPKYLAGKVKPQQQNHSKATYSKILTRGSGFLDDKLPVAPGLLDRMTRAYYPWPGAWTRVTRLQHNPLTGKLVKFLPGGMVQVEGKKPMSYKDFRNGYPQGDIWLKKFLT